MGQAMVRGSGRRRAEVSVSGRGLTSAWLAGNLVPFLVLWGLTGSQHPRHAPSPGISPLLSESQRSGA